MKEASGELNMTLITIMAVALIGALFYFLYPSIKSAIESKWGTVDTSGQSANING